MLEQASDCDCEAKSRSIFWCINELGMEAEVSTYKEKKKIVLVVEKCQDSN